MLDTEAGSSGRPALMAETVYLKMIKRLLEEESPLLAGWEAEGRKLISRLKSRDPIEQMMVGHLLWMNAQIAHFGWLAMIQTQTAHADRFNEICTRTMSTFRKHIEGLSLYRNPESRKFVAVKQANFAGQQIVGNLNIQGKSKRMGARNGKKTGKKNHKKNPQTEIGRPQIDRAQIVEPQIGSPALAAPESNGNETEIQTGRQGVPHADPAELHIERSGQSETSAIDPQEPPLAEKHGPEDADRQTDLQPECG